jgi:hypothetical protein
MLARAFQAENRVCDFANPLQNNETHRIVEQYEMTHFDGDAPLGQSETKDGVDMVWVQAGFNGCQSPIALQMTSRYVS